MDWLIGILPIALMVLMCPLMMIVMMPAIHGAHGNSHGGVDIPGNRITGLERQVNELREKRDGKHEKAA